MFVSRLLLLALALSEKQLTEIRADGISREIHYGSYSLLDAHDG
jgi:hypothetical protein